MTTVLAPLRRGGDDRRERLAARARRLSWLSLAYMTAEGAIAIGAGIAAASVALVGFGIDSAIEGLASAIIVWRFSGDRIWSDAAERRAQRLVAAQFFLLAPYVAQDAVRTLAGGGHPEASWLGIGLAASSLVVMPSSGRRRSGSPRGSARPRPGARGARTCSARTSRGPCSWACWGTRSWARGGSTPPWAC